MQALVLLTADFPAVLCRAAGTASAPSGKVPSALALRDGDGVVPARGCGPGERPLPRPEPTTQPRALEEGGKGNHRSKILLLPRLLTACSGQC